MIDAAVIVPMRADHVDALMPYEHEMFGPEAWSADGYRAEIADTARCYIAAEDAQGVLLGWAGVLVIGDAAEILTVGVIPAARRRGIGTTLLRALCEQARTRGCREVFLEVRVDNDPARELYEREGFARLGTRRGYYDHGRMDATVMRRAL